MIYSFRIKPEDTDIYNTLQNLSGKERAEFIRNALRFYIQNRDVLLEIKRDISELKQILQQEHSNLPGYHKISEPESNSKTDKEKILDDLLDQFMNM